MSPHLADSERQAEAAKIGERILADAWTFLSEGYPDEQPTAYRRVYGALQMILAAIPPEDETMAIAAIGSVLGAVSVQRPDLNVARLFGRGFVAAQETAAAPRGAVQ
jgi:hypothetical protein